MAFADGRGFLMMSLSQSHRTCLQLSVINNVLSAVITLYFIAVSTIKQGRSHVSKIGGVHFSFLSLWTSNYSGQMHQGEEWGGSVPSPVD